jgi:hypothetical protein
LMISSSAATMTATAIDTQRISKGTSGAKVIPKPKIRSYCPSRSNSAGMCTWSAL